jgi:tryptophanyl-tRNA synthetase
MANNASNKSDKNKYMQESMIVLQRAKNDELSRAQPDDFDFDIFESIIQSRMLFIEGKSTDAKKAFEESQINIEKAFTDYPVSMAADSLKIMLDLVPEI